ncbi:MAG: FkbM family methyltransferase [Saprospiraceae bacterium]|nr:FkbM family methyltransferase [Saprospiraceae bacterium]
MIDIGASIGFYSLLISGLIDDRGLVLAIEPSQEAFQLLQVNSAEMTNISARQISVGAKDKLGTIYTFPAKYAEYNTLNIDPFLTQSRWYNHKNVTHESVPVKSLDNILLDLHILPDIVKLDAENSDIAIVQGMHDIIEKAHPEIIMRYWPQDRDHTQQVTAIEKLQSLGYRLYGFNSEGSLIDGPHLDKYIFEYVILKYI